MGTLLVVQGAFSPPIARVTHPIRLLTYLVFRHTLIPPRGYSIAGVSGSCGQWVDGFSLVITR